MKIISCTRRNILLAVAFIVVLLNFCYLGPTSKAESSVPLSASAPLGLPYYSPDKPLFWLEDGGTRLHSQLFPSGYVFDVGGVQGELQRRKAAGLYRDAGRLCDPSLDKSEKAVLPTVMFLHVYKAGGTTTDQFFRALAETCGVEGENAWLTLKHYDAKYEHCTVMSCVPPEIEAKFREWRVIFGHFFYGFEQMYANNGFVYVSTLRVPHITVVSGYQQTRLEQKKPIDSVEDGIRDTAAFVKKKVGTYRMDFIRRFAGVRDIEDPVVTLPTYLMSALENMKAFDVIGLVERWDTSVKMYRQAFDPDGRVPKKVWSKISSSTKKNAGYVSSSKIWEGLDDESKQIVADFTIFERVFYEASKILFREQCRFFLKEKDWGSCEVEDL